MLARIIPRHRRAHEAIVDALPGHSGRPAGTGEPPGGRGASTSSVVERTALRRSSEWVTLDRFTHLSAAVVDQADTLTRASVGRDIYRPASVSRVRQLVWARWAVRVLLDLEHDGVARIDRRGITAMFGTVADLAALVDRWTVTPTAPARPASSDMADDLTETWCVSCLRTGRRTPRCDRYASSKVCRSCGDFTANHGWPPTLDIVDALADGRYTDVARLVRDEKQRRNKKRKKR